MSSILKELENCITTKQAAKELEISVRRVNQLIENKRLPSLQIGRDHFIKKTDLELVRERKAGRPKKEKKTE